MSLRKPIVRVPLLIARDLWQNAHYKRHILLTVVVALFLLLLQRLRNKGPYCVIGHFRIDRLKDGKVKAIALAARNTNILGFQIEIRTIQMTHKYKKNHQIGQAKKSSRNIWKTFYLNVHFMYCV